MHAAQIISHLVQQRRKLGYTQTEVAEKLNITQSTLAGFESSDNPRLQTLLRYASVVGMTLVAVREEEQCDGS